MSHCFGHLWVTSSAGIISGSRQKGRKRVNCEICRAKMASPLTFHNVCVWWIKALKCVGAVEENCAKMWFYVRLWIRAGFKTIRTTDCGLMNSNSTYRLLVAASLESRSQKSRVRVDWRANAHRKDSWKVQWHHFRLDCIQHAEKWKKPTHMCTETHHKPNLSLFFRCKVPF